MSSHLSDVWFRTTDLEVVRGSGCTVTTADGEEYLDFTAGIAVASTGHSHPRVVAAIVEQAGLIIHAQANCYRSPLPEELATRLAQITPSRIDTFFFSNSGAEATEAAVKLARHATGRPNVIVVQGGFHGRTYLTMAMTTSKVGVRAGYQPLPAGVFVTSFPRPFAWKVDEATAVERALADLRLLLATQTAPGETAALVMEPVLGEGGYLPAPPAFVRGAYEICAEHGILFVADEVQTGFARTGRMFAVEHSSVQPDIMVMAKGIASGFPISAIGARADLMAQWKRGAHGGTYGANPIGCAAALATIDVILDELLVVRSVQVDAAGQIALPLVGTVDVKGKTAAQLSAALEKILGAKYLRDPQVTVTVAASVSQKVSIQGEVSEPGVYPMTGPTTLLGVISLAKGETDVATLKQVVVFRTVNGQRMGAVFDVASIRRGQADDPVMQGNDMVVVGSSAAKKFWKDVVTAAPVFNIFRPVTFSGL